MDDLISRQGALDALDKRFEEFLRCFGFDSYEKADRSTRLACDGISEAEDVIMGLPSVPPDTYWKEQCQSYERTINKLRESLSAKSESFEWCTDCKEYDQEAHCCHRWSKMIRKTVEEMKLVHCIDCRHSEYDSVYGDRYCHYNGKAEVVDDYHFCRDGEKKDNDVTCENCDYSEKFVDGLILCRRTKTSHRVSATSTCGKGKREVEDAEAKV